MRITDIEAVKTAQGFNPHCWVYASDD